MRGYLRWVSEKCGSCLGAQEQMVPRGMQNPKHPGFVAPDQPYSCGQCIASHATQYAFPPLESENVLAWDLYMSVQDQQRVGMDLIGLDYTVLPFAFDLWEVPKDQRRLLFEKLQIANHEVTARRAEKRKEEQKRRENEKRVDR